MISIVILTKNEEKDLPDCLQNVAWCDDIFVLDSFSTDNTIRILEDNNIRYQQNKFSGFGQQRNFVLDNIILKYDWIYFLDADERITPKLLQEIRKEIYVANNSVAGFHLCWKMMLEGRWLKYSDNFPKWQFRILRKGKARFIDVGHGQKELILSGEAKYIKEPYLHYGFSKGWSHWIDRHNKYATKEAIERKENPKKISDILVKSKRNAALKYWLVKIPGWPLIRFLQAYFLNLGFLEGRQGFTYCVNMAYYEFLIKIKMQELKKHEQNNTNTGHQFLQ